MTTLLVRDIHTLVTMNAARDELKGASVLVRDGVIEQVGRSSDLPATADEVLDLKGRYLVMPGLVNTHHHFYQTLTRAIPAAQNADLFGWLKILYPIWARLTAEGVRASAQMCAAELMLSGCTTASDHLYIFPNDATLDDEVRAMQDIGMRFHASRGSMSVGETLGGLPPDSVVESESDILRDSQRLIETWHDARRYSMTRLTLAPCSPFSVSPALMRESAALARSYPGVRLHTHLAESRPDVDYSLATFGMTPGRYAESVNWLGPDVWHAHCVWLDDEAITQFARTGTGVAHCPCSNMRLASGFAPIRKMRAASVPVGLGTDGAASNDATNLFQEARQAFLSARVRDLDAAAMSAREALEIATLGGARVLGRDDIGCLAPGMAADFIAVDLDRPSFAGALHDPVGALVLCEVGRVDYSFINGRRVVDSGRLTTAELPKLAETVNRLAAAMVLA
ncbi:MAG: 8-oxoguanine deaminase [Gammaproteobacteria bacterium]|jgi:cytosine/adenosine deaminase-related metal-dependent hydrolase|nr:8-oxoguanine deaminase [Gammaproteobacteria bacterium]